MNADGGSTREDPPHRLGDALDAIRERMFVGRRAELEAFDRELARPRPRPIFVHGPGGIGKTTLAREFGRRASRRGLEVVHLSGHELPAARAAIVNAITGALGRASDDLEQLRSHTERTPSLVVVDGFESIASMEPFIGGELAPALAPGSAMVTAGRNEPSPAAWTADVETIRLDNLEWEAAAVLMDRHGIDEALRRDIYDASRGYPLALALVASLDPSSAAEVQLEDNPDLVATLLERIIGDVPTPAHRRALRLACLSAYAPTELLRPITGGAGGGIGEWLRKLAFVEQTRGGLRVHDIVRDCVVEDMRWRSPGELHALRRIARDHFLERLRRPDGHLDASAQLGVQHLFRHYEAGRAALEAMPDFFDTDIATPEAPAAEDWTRIEEAIARHEGEESSEIWRHWRDRGAETVVVRDREGITRGFATILWVDDLDAVDAARDPCTSKMTQWIRARGWTHPVFLARFWMAFEQHQDASRARVSLYQWFSRQACARRGPSAGFSVHANADEVARQAALWRAHGRFPELDFELGGRRYALMGSVWERDAFDELVVSSVDALTSEDAVPPRAPTRGQLAREVKRALRDVHRLDLLEASLLADTPLVPRDRSPRSRAEALSALIVDTCHRVRFTEDGERLFAVLERTYLDPAVKQLAAAMDLGMSYATYRRWLRRAVDRAAELLWERLERPGGG